MRGAVAVFFTGIRTFGSADAFLPGRELGIRRRTFAGCIINRSAVGTASYGARLVPANFSHGFALGSGICKISVTAADAVSAAAGILRDVGISAVIFRIHKNGSRTGHRNIFGIIKAESPGLISRQEMALGDLERIWHRFQSGVC